MKHYKFETDETDQGRCIIYTEVDWGKDLVVKQVDVYHDFIRWGEWDGARLVGFIADQSPSGFDPPLRPKEEITQDEFEVVWKRAKRQDV